LAELRSYSYRVDKLTGLPLTEPQDKDNHLLDALRYAMADLIQNRGEPGILQFYRDEIAKQTAAKTAAPKAETKDDGSEPLRRPFWLTAQARGGRVSDI